MEDLFFYAALGFFSFLLGYVVGRFGPLIADELAASIAARKAGTFAPFSERTDHG